MDKELKEMLNHLKEMLEIATSDNFDKAKEKFSEIMDEALKQPCKIKIEKDKKGKAKMGVEGQRLALLVTLAGAEQGILKQLKCDNDEFEFIKQFVGTREAGDNE